jgi:hypothetical protein
MRQKVNKMNDMTKARSTNLVYIIPGKYDTSTAPFTNQGNQGTRTKQADPSSRAKQGPRASQNQQSKHKEQPGPDRERDRDLEHKNPLDRNRTTASRAHQAQTEGLGWQGVG